MGKERFAVTKALWAALLILGIVLGFVGGWFLKPSPELPAPQVTTVTETVEITMTKTVENLLI